MLSTKYVHGSWNIKSIYVVVGVGIDGWYMVDTAARFRRSAFFFFCTPTEIFGPFKNWKNDPRFFLVTQIWFNSGSVLRPVVDQTPPRWGTSAIPWRDRRSSREDHHCYPDSLATYQSNRNWFPLVDIKVSNILLRLLFGFDVATFFKGYRATCPKEKT